MKRQRKAMDQLMEAIRQSFDEPREHPDEYSSDEKLKPICAPDVHHTHGNSTICEKCGMVVADTGANLPIAPGLQ